MVEVVIIIREAGRTKPDFSLKFELPEVPAVGSYISINRPDERQPYGQDAIVRQVWWRLFHPVTAGYASDTEEDRAGSVTEIMVECEPALSPYSSSSWKRALGGKPDIETFDVSRTTFPYAEGDD